MPLGRLPEADLDDPTLGRLTDDWLTRDYRVLQRAQGHRFSSDDMATAYVAWKARPEARSVLDLGCGLGSVLLQVLRTEGGVGRKVRRGAGDEVEAERGSSEASQRGFVAEVPFRNGDAVGEAIPLHIPPQELEGDRLRLHAQEPGVGQRPGQLERAYARIEYRGGVEAYLEAGAKVLAPEGRLVICGDVHAAPRVESTSSSLGLHLHARCHIIPREGRSPLFAIWTLGWAPTVLIGSTLTLRSATGERTPDADRLRAFSGW